MSPELRTVFRAIFYGLSDPPAGKGGEPLGGCDFTALPGGDIGRALGAFALDLSAEPDSGNESGRGSTSHSRAAAAHPHAGKDTPRRDGGMEFLLRGAALIREELSTLERSNPDFARAVADAARFLGSQGSRWNAETRRRLWRVFFPEGAATATDPDGAAETIRRRRRITIESLNPVPITDVAAQVLFTSNVLLTVPESPEAARRLGLSAAATGAILAALEEPQDYYYDHPIRMGVAPEHNEVLYGLRNLDAAVDYEKRLGTVAPEARVTVALSVSVTHTSLHAAAREYLSAVAARAGGFDHLTVYAFTEDACRRMVAETLAPQGEAVVREELTRIFGVDGEYGRHYSFLKALAAWWNVYIDPEIRATFKIDLDQVFPQERLFEETGRSAFQHLMTDRWGATGVDAHGRTVELGLIAGALVNERDISGGLFTPDVTLPEEVPPGETAVFLNTVPMAVSTRAEMMARYDDSSTCLQRYHVTGGTNGILVDHLRRYRPFTPTFVGRAEDQAYIMSVLFAPDTGGGTGDGAGGTGDGGGGTGDGGGGTGDGAGTAANLRYVHEPGLIMRHDKEAFAGEAIAAAALGRFVGDLVRTVIFSRYAALLPWGFDAIKGELDPFTGAFITRRCYTVVFLRLVLKLAELYQAGRLAGGEAGELLAIARRKLEPLLPTATIDPATVLEAQYESERRGWDRFYAALDHPTAAACRRAGEIVAGARVDRPREA
ncbi:MAG: hypothetical protein ACLFO1_08535 [Spirochaetaceae bacterium]